VDAFGKREQARLTPRGWQRAGALVRWIAPLPRNARRSTRRRPSSPRARTPTAMRTVLTMQPLAKLLGLRIRSRIAGEDVATLSRP
jgi:hypothetical protein